MSPAKFLGLTRARWSLLGLTFAGLKKTRAVKLVLSFDSSDSEIFQNAYVRSIELCFIELA